MVDCHGLMLNDHQTPCRVAYNLQGESQNFVFTKLGNTQRTGLPEHLSGIKEGTRGEKFEKLLFIA